MTRIVAIGGGEIGRPGCSIETQSIDQEVIKLSGKSRPRLLFLPTASNDDQEYIDLVQAYYGNRLGCSVETLCLSQNPSSSAIQTAVNQTDIIYVGGGNTLRMMTQWRKYGLDKILCKASKDKILAGVSAGAICWFQTGLSDSRSYTTNGKTWQYIKVRGLGLHDFMVAPHYDSAPDCQPSLKHALKGTSKIAIALEECTALEIVDGTYRIITSKNGQKAYKVYWKDREYRKEAIGPSIAYLPLANLHQRR